MSLSINEENRALKHWNLPPKPQIMRPVPPVPLFSETDKTSHVGAQRMTDLSQSNKENRIIDLTIREVIEIDTHNNAVTLLKNLQSKRPTAASYRKLKISLGIATSESQTKKKVNERYVKTIKSLPTPQKQKIPERVYTMPEYSAPENPIMTREEWGAYQESLKIAQKEMPLPEEVTTVIKRKAAGLPAQISPSTLILHSESLKAHFNQMSYEKYLKTQIKPLPFPGMRVEKHEAPKVFNGGKISFEYLAKNERPVPPSVPVYSSSEYSMEELTHIVNNKGSKLMEEMRKRGDDIVKEIRATT